MPSEIQAKFLRVIQEGEIRPLGSTQTKKVDVRIVAAASENLRGHWNQSSAASELAVHEKTVRNKMKKYHIKKS